MQVKIKIAKSTQELDEVFRARHRVFVEQERYFSSRPEGRIFDRFDSFPTTINVIAMVGTKVIGGGRFMEASDAGMTTDEYFNFHPFLPAGTERICAGSLLFVERRYRCGRGLGNAICNLGYYWAISRGLTHVLAAINPEVEAFFRRASYQAGAPQMYCKSNQLPFVPMVLDLGALRTKCDSLREYGIDSGAFDGAAEEIEILADQEGARIAATRHPYKTSLLLEYESAHG